MGVILDSLLSSSHDKNTLRQHSLNNLKVETTTLNLNTHASLSSSASSSSSTDSRRNSGSDAILKSATGNIEVDECLRHHLNRAIGSLEVSF